MEHDASYIDASYRMLLQQLLVLSFDRETQRKLYPGFVPIIDEIADDYITPMSVLDRLVGAGKFSQHKAEELKRIQDYIERELLEASGKIYATSQENGDALTRILFILSKKKLCQDRRAGWTGWGDIFSHGTEYTGSRFEPAARVSVAP